MLFGEISTLTNIAKPDIAVITNVGTSHIGELGSRENILKAKLEILEGLNDEGTLVINNDNDMLNEWNKINNTYKTFTFGIEANSDVTAKNINLQEYSSSFTVNLNEEKTKEEIKVEIPVGGKHFVYNGLCAVAVGKILGIPNNDIQEGIKEFKLTKNRMDVRKIKDNITIINDCYNANYDSMSAAVTYLAKINAKRKIAVLGDMLNLGEYSKDLHEKVGEDVASNRIDVLITVGNEARNIVKKAIEEGMKEENICNLKTNEEAIEQIKKMLKPEDAVLVKASNAMNFNKIVEALIIK